MAVCDARCGGTAAEVKMNLSVKYWKKHKSRLFSICSAILISTIALTCAAFFSRSASLGNFIVAINAAGEYDIIIPSADEDIIAAVNESPSVYETGIVLNGGMCATNGSAAKSFGSLPDGKTARLFHFIPTLGGRYPEKQGEITGYKSSFEELGVAAVKGNVFSLELYAINGEFIRSEEFTIVGVLNDQNSDYNYHGAVRKIDKFNAERIDYEFPEMFVYKDDLPAESIKTMLVLCMPDVTSWKFVNELRESSIFAIDTGRLTGLATMAMVSSENQNELYERAPKAYNDFYSRTVIPVFTVIIMLVSFLSIYDIVTTSIIERQKQLGLLRCVGISRKRALFMTLKESLFMSVTGVPLGFAAGILLYTAAVEVCRNILKIDMYYAFTVHPIVAAATINPYVYPVIIGLICSLSAAFIPFIRNLNKSPLEILSSDKNNKIQKVSEKRDAKNKTLILRKSIGGSSINNISSFIIILLITWSAVFGYLFFAAQADFDNMFHIEKLNDVDASQMDYSARRDLRGAQMSNAQFNRHNEGISPALLEELKNSPDVEEVIGIIKVPGIKAVYDDSAENETIRQALSAADISGNVDDFVSEFNQKSLFAKGYNENESLYNIPMAGVSDALLRELEQYLIDGEVNLERLKSGEETLIVEFEGHDSINPFRVGDIIPLTDVVIDDITVETYDFLSGTVPAGYEPAFYWDYPDGSLTDMQGFAFGRRVDFGVRVGGIIRLPDDRLANIIFSETYVMNETKNGSMDIGFNLLCSTDALTAWKLPDTNYTDVMVNLSDGADMERFEMLWYNIMGHGKSMKLTSRKTLERSIDDSEAANTAIFLVMIIMVVILGMFGVINSSKLRVKRSMKNISIMRAVGLKKSVLRKYFLVTGIVEPMIAAATAWVPLVIFDAVKNYAYDYGFRDGHNEFIDRGDGVQVICWQVLYPWWIELWKQPVFITIIITFAAVAFLNILASIIPGNWVGRQIITDAIKEETF